MSLDDIGFYTLSDERASHVSLTSPLKRCEILLTQRCNLSCPYCRKLAYPEVSLAYAQYVLGLWVEDGLQNVRFSGGEPTLYKDLISLVGGCKNSGVKRIAISTNGTMPFKCYQELASAGVNDFSISLDGGCCATNQEMNGGVDSFERVSENIRKLSWYNYVTVGAVFNEFNVHKAKSIIEYIDSLNPSDIRVISSAQYNRALNNLIDLDESILNRHPILKYRIQNFKAGRNVRGIQGKDTRKCHLVKDDVAVAGKYHFPCIIYLREGGNPIGEMNGDFRKQRWEWFEKHDTHSDPICRENCLDVCIDYNNTAEKLNHTGVVRRTL